MGKSSSIPPAEKLFTTRFYILWFYNFVVFLSAFVLKFVVLDGLYGPQGSLAQRLLVTLLEGISLGSLGYAPHGAATGYVAFATVVGYLFTLVLLPQRAQRQLRAVFATDESLVRPDQDGR